MTLHWWKSWQWPTRRLLRAELKLIPALEGPFSHWATYQPHKVPLHTFFTLNISMCRAVCLIRKLTLGYINVDECTAAFWDFSMHSDAAVIYGFLCASSPFGLCINAHVVWLGLCLLHQGLFCRAVHRFRRSRRRMRRRSRRRSRSRRSRRRRRRA